MTECANCGHKVRWDAGEEYCRTCVVEGKVDEGGDDEGSDISTDESSNGRKYEAGLVGVFNSDGTPHTIDEIRQSEHVSYIHPAPRIETTVEDLIARDPSHGTLIASGIDVDIGPADQSLTVDATYVATNDGEILHCYPFDASVCVDDGDSVQVEIKPLS